MCKWHIIVRERFLFQVSVFVGPYGDIDLLITDSGYDKTTPRGALGELCDRLMRRGHMAYHLTHLKGMTREAEISQSSSASHQTLPSPPPAKQVYPTSQSYMGVFYSPYAGKKRRRIDIKFYLNAPLRPCTSLATAGSIDRCVYGPKRPRASP